MTFINKYSIQTIQITIFALSTKNPATHDLHKQHLTTRNITTVTQPPFHIGFEFLLSKLVKFWHNAYHMYRVALPKWFGANIKILQPHTLQCLQVISNCHISAQTGAHHTWSIFVKECTGYGVHRHKRQFEFSMCTVQYCKVAIWPPTSIMVT